MAPSRGQRANRGGEREVRGRRRDRVPVRVRPADVLRDPATHSRSVGGRPRGRPAVRRRAGPRRRQARARGPPRAGVPRRREDRGSWRGVGGARPPPVGYAAASRTNHQKGWLRRRTRSPKAPRLARLSASVFYAGLGPGSVSRASEVTLLPLSSGRVFANHSYRTTSSGKPAPAANRSSLYGERSSADSPWRSSSATARPTAGDCMKPWPEKPQAV
jgi:hypothetical protein